LYGGGIGWPLLLRLMMMTRVDQIIESFWMADCRIWDGNVVALVAGGAGGQQRYIPAILKPAGRTVLQSHLCNVLNKMHHWR
jgi:hypothetical protein